MTDSSPEAVRFEITEPAETPWLDVFFGYIAMVPFPFGLIASWLAPEPWRDAALAATLFWGCAILTFLSGVRRGLSFRTPGGATAAQLGTMLWLFCLSFAALVLAATGLNLASAILLLAGYLSVEILDPVAARRREAPLSFARLRPAQMAIPITCLVLAIVLMLWR